MTTESEEKAKDFAKRTSNLNVLLAMKKCGDRDLANPTNFPRAKMVLTVACIGSGSRQVWSMIEEARKSFPVPSQIVIMKN